MEENGFEFESEDLTEIISTIKHDRLDSERSNLPEDAIHYLEFKLGLCSYNLVFPELNENPIWVQFSKYSPEEYVQLETLQSRLYSVCDAAYESGLTAIAFDAE